MQEAYRPPCSEYFFCCSTWVPPGRVPPAGYPPARYPPGRVPPWVGYPLAGYPQQGTPWAGYPPGKVPPGVCPMELWVMLQSIMGYGYPSRCLAYGILGNVAKHYGIWVPLPVDRQTDTCQNITFPSYYVRGR